jgi:hypothetical protein
MHGRHKSQTSLSLVVERTEERESLDCRLGGSGTSPEGDKPVPSSHSHLALSTTA